MIGVMPDTRGRDAEGIVNFYHSFGEPYARKPASTVREEMLGNV
jgi:hypothetical protein